jgi:hypothetical protein
MNRSYTELLTHGTFLSRFEYLKLGGTVGQETFGLERQLNQDFYSSREWKHARDVCMIRDAGRDLGVQGHDIFDKVFVHHMNPIQVGDLYPTLNPAVLDPEYLICVSFSTHNAIHYGDESLLPQPLVERRPGDHILWERQW